MTNSTITGNSTANRGGGVGNFGTLTVTNSTITGNSNARYDGGGILNRGFINYYGTIYTATLTWHAR